LADANISLEDPANGVLLSWNYRRNKNPNTYTAYDAQYPSALPHDGTVHNNEYYGKVYDRLEVIRLTYPSQLNATQRSELQRELRRELGDIADENLAGNF